MRSPRSHALLVVTALATMHYCAASAPLAVGSFSELDLAVGSGLSSEITWPEILFDHQLEVRQARTALVIESTIGAILSGGYQTRLFFLQNGSKLSLRGVDLRGGVATGDCSNCSPHGGAILMSTGSELRLLSTRMFNNRAGYGGAIYAIRSTVTAIESTMSSNSVRRR